MANDLSKAQPRTTQQDRITRNRGSMFRQNDTEAPQRRYYQDFRNASRGDGGAQALMEALGMVQKGVNSFQQYADDKFQVDEQRNSAQGAVDFATGHVDPELEQKSRAYRDSLSLGRAQKDWSEGLSGFDNEVQTLIQNQTATDPEARKAEVNGLLDDYYKRFALDENGKVKDFGSPGANKWLAEQMVQTRATALEQAGAVIDKRMGEESVTNMTATVRAQLLGGQDVDWSQAMTALLPSVDRKAAMGDLLTTVKDVAMTLRDKGPDEAQRGLRILDGLLGYAASQPGGIKQVDPGASAAAPQGQPEAGSYVTPFDGFGSIKVSSKMGAPREGGSAHNGEDFPMPVGTAIKAPMGGEVIGSWRNARGGNQLRIKLDDGTIVGFAHLSSRDVKVGQRVEAGQVVAASGNTGRTTGPHLHATAERDGKKVSFSAVFAGAPRGGPAHPATAPIDPSVVDPAKPTELADAAGPAQVTPPTGAIQLTSEQRVDLTEFRRTLRKQVDDAAAQKLDEDRTANANILLTRISGLGTYPTMSELQEAARTGQIDPRQFATLVNTVQADQRQALSDARQAKNEAESDQDDNREKRAVGVIGSVLGPVYRGEKTPAEQAKLLLDIAAREPDLKTRQAILSGAGEELSKVTSLRTKSPQYAHAADTLDSWQQTYVSSLTSRVLGRKVTREQAQALIKQRMDQAAAAIGRGDIAPDKVDAYLKSIEPQLDSWFDHTFPRRPTPHK